ncbi:MAG TPA: hypothetical protein VFY95_06020 [Sphingomicrobium sp.]
MTAPVPGIEAAEDSTAEALLRSFKGMSASERRKHASVFNYWLSIRRDRDLPPIRDLDPLEISDVAPCSVLLELVGGGENAEIRHLGATLKSGAEPGLIADAPKPSALSSIAGKLGIVAISRDALAFEDMFEAEDGTTRCSVTLLPFSTAGETVDFVYGLVSIETGVTAVEEIPEAIAEEPEPSGEVAADAEIAPSPPEEAVAESEPEAAATPDEAVVEAEAVQQETEAEPETIEPEPFAEPAQAEAGNAKPGFSAKVFDALAGAKGFFGTVASATPSATPEPPAEKSAPVAEESEPIADEPEPVAEESEPIADEPEPVAEEPEPIADEPEPVAEEPEPIADEPELVAEEPAPATEEPAPVEEISAPVAEEIPAPAAEEPVESPHCPMEGTLQSKLVEVRGKAEEAQAAKLRAEAALIDGLSAAYDFALDAEDAPEEYLKLVEAEGLKIQLRSPMAPVVKLAFDGSCDEPTIKQLEAVLSWALKMELPRGSLGQRVAAEGGIGSVLGGRAKAA